MRTCNDSNGATLSALGAMALRSLAICKRRRSFFDKRRKSSSFTSTLVLRGGRTGVRDINNVINATALARSANKSNPALIYFVINTNTFF